MLKLNNCLNLLIKRLFNKQNNHHICSMEVKDKKHIILEKAEALFAELGFSGTSVREIAKAADVNVAMISYYFGSKEKLLMEIFRYRSDYLKTQVDDLLNKSALSFWDKLDVFIEHYVYKIKQNQHLHRIIMREVDRSANTEMSAFVIERKKEHFKMICDFFVKGQEAGDFDKDADLLYVYNFFPAITKQILFNRDFLSIVITDKTGKEPDVDDLAEMAIDYLKNTLRKILKK